MSDKCSRCEHEFHGGHICKVEGCFSGPCGCGSIPIDVPPMPDKIILPKVKGGFPPMPEMGVDTIGIDTIGIRKPLPGEHTTWSQYQVLGWCWLQKGHEGPCQCYGGYVCSLARDAGHCGKAEVIAEYRAPYGREFDPTWDWPPLIVERVVSKLIPTEVVKPEPFKGGLTSGVFFMDFPR